MQTTYRAVLRGDRLEWRSEIPPEASPEREVSVDVTILHEVGSPKALGTASAGEQMAAALEKLAGSKAVAAIEDPVAWQREVRRDRSLPGRD